MKRIVVGRLMGVFGIHGEIKCRAEAFATDVFAAGATFALGSDAGARELRCTGARRHHERLLLRFEGIATPEDARTLVGADLYTERGEPELGRDEYLDADLIGLHLVDERGRDVARVVGVQHFPAQDCLVVEPGNALVPLVKAFIRSVDVAAGVIVVDLPDGLI